MQKTQAVQEKNCQSQYNARFNEVPSMGMGYSFPLELHEYQEQHYPLKPLTRLLLIVICNYITKLAKIHAYSLSSTRDLSSLMIIFKAKTFP